MNRQDFPHI